jgi:tRNA (mo5U34)-methyltransferase
MGASKQQVTWDDPAAMNPQVADAARSARDAVASNESWYHTMELAPGVVTPGWFDLRPVLPRLPWPDVQGKRCLDVGTYDGHLAFELERRGASEVIATDIERHLDWDWPVRHRETTANELWKVAGETKGKGFEIAKEILDSRVEREWISIYDLSPERLGSFDVVVCGSLLLHLRDPVRALEAVRGVCSPNGRFMSCEQIDLELTVAHPRSPVARFDGTSDLLHWWTVNRAGHRRMLESAGFEVLESSGLYDNPLGPGHSPVPQRPSILAKAALRRAFTGGVGIPSVAFLTRPDPSVELSGSES